MIYHISWLSQISIGDIVDVMSRTYQDFNTL